MLRQTFTVQGCSLNLLKAREQGVVSRIQGKDDSVVQKLRSMNITPGTQVTVEQRSPRFIVRVGCDQIALSDPLRDAIYVRLS